MKPYVYFSDGVYGISVQRHGGTIRFLPDKPGSDKPEFIGTAIWHIWTPTVSGLLALNLPNGSLTMRHMALLAHGLADAGVQWLMSERANGSLPFAVPCVDPKFDGWLELDVAMALKRARARYTATPIVKS